jgi:hypothetical protein
VATRTFTNPLFTCRVEHPDDWHVRVGAPASVDDPRDALAVSNRPIAPQRPGDATRRAVVEQLEGDAVLVWVHYRLPGDRDVGLEDPAPDYSRMRYASHEDGRARVPSPPGWPSTQLTWRRPVAGDEVTVTAEAWEGGSVDEADARRLVEVVNSLTVEFRT